MKNNTHAPRFSPKGVKVILAVAALTGCLIQERANAQDALATQPQNFNNYINWSSLATLNPTKVDPNGLSASLLTSVDGQTFSLNSLGSYYFGNTLTIRVTGGTLNIVNSPTLNDYQAMMLTVAEGQVATIGYTFSQPLEARMFGGGVVAPSERTSYTSNGTALNPGSLLNQKALEDAGLTITDDSVYNPTSADISGPGGLLWQSNVEATNYVTTIENVLGGDTSLATIFTMSVGQVPEPSSAMLMLSGITFLLFKRRRI